MHFSVVWWTIRSRMHSCCCVGVRHLVTECILVAKAGKAFCHAGVMPGCSKAEDSS